MCILRLITKHEGIQMCRSPHTVHNRLLGYLVQALSSVFTYHCLAGKVEQIKQISLYLSQQKVTQVTTVCDTFM